MNKKNSEDRGSKHRRSSVEEPDLNKLSTLSNNPVVWRRTAVGFRIEDIKEKYFDDVIEILKVHHDIRDNQIILIRLVLGTYLILILFTRSSHISSLVFTNCFF